MARADPRPDDFNYVSWAGPASGGAPVFFEFVYVAQDEVQLGRASSRGVLFELRSGLTDARLPKNRLPRAPSTGDAGPELQRDGFGHTGHAALSRRGRLHMVDVEGAPGEDALPSRFDAHRSAVLKVASESSPSAEQNGAYVQIRPLPLGAGRPANAPLLAAEGLAPATWAQLESLLQRPYRFQKLSEEVPAELNTALRQTTGGRPIFIQTKDRLYYATLFKLN